MDVNERRGSSRRAWLAGLGVLGLGGVVWAVRRRIVSKLSQWTLRDDFGRTPALLPHDPVKDRQKLAVSQGKSPADNIDVVLGKLGGLPSFIGKNDVVLVKVSAQWWNQGMTNVAATRRVIEQILAIPDFTGEVIVFENTHFRLADGSGLARAFTRPSDRNVDVPGWNKLGDLVTHFASQKNVSFVGLVDAGASLLAGDEWHDPGHSHGVYGGDGRGPIGQGDDRDGYHWDFDQAFRVPRSAVDDAQTPLTWPVFTAPSGTGVDLKEGLFRRIPAGRASDERTLRWITLTTANEHAATGMTGCCKSAMGIVDMSAGRLGTHPAARGYSSVHYFGEPNASWRMAGPLADFARRVRAPDLYLTIAEYVGVTPAGYHSDEDIRHSEACAHHTQTVVGGTDAVAIDAWVVRNLFMPIGGANRAMYDLDIEDSKLTKFLRYYRQVYGAGTLDPKLVELV